MNPLLGLFFFIALVVPIAFPEISAGPVTLDAAMLSLGLLLLIIILYVPLKEHAPNLDSPYVPPFLIFLAVGLLATFLAYDVMQSLQMWMRYLAYFSLVIVAASGIRSVEQAKKILVLMIIAGVVASLYGFYTYVFHPEIIQVGAWGLGPNIKNRIAGTFPDANWFGEYLVLTIPAALAMVFVAKKISNRLLALGATGLMMFALLMTYSRGSWLALALALGIFVILVEKRLIAPLVAMAAVGLAMMPGMAERLTSITQTSSGTAGFRSRLWQIYFGEFFERPLTGTGLGNSFEAFTHFNMTHPVTGMITPPFSAHNYYIGTLVETGILGLLAILMIIAVVIRLGILIHIRSEPGSDMRILNAAILGAFTGIFFNGLTSSLFTHPRVFIVLWLLVGVQALFFRLTKEQPYVEADDSTGLLTSIKTSSLVYGWLSKTPFTGSLINGSIALQLAGTAQERIIAAKDRIISGSAIFSRKRNSTLKMPQQDVT